MPYVSCENTQGNESSFPLAVPQSFPCRDPFLARDHHTADIVSNNTTTLWEGSVQCCFIVHISGGDNLNSFRQRNKKLPFVLLILSNEELPHPLCWNVGSQKSWRMVAESVAQVREAHLNLYTLSTHHMKSYSCNCNARAGTQEVLRGILTRPGTQNSTFQFRCRWYTARRTWFSSFSLDSCSLSTPWDPSPQHLTKFDIQPAKQRIWRIFFRNFHQNGSNPTWPPQITFCSCYTRLANTGLVAGCWFVLSSEKATDRWRGAFFLGTLSSSK